MSSRYRVEQRKIVHDGRQFHFVSYEGQPANVKRDEPATEDAWFLVNAGYRQEVMPQHAGQETAEVDRLLTEWLTRSMAHVEADSVKP